MMMLGNSWGRGELNPFFTSNTKTNWSQIKYLSVRSLTKAFRTYTGMGQIASN